MKFSFTLLLFCLMGILPTFGQGDTLSRSFVHEDSLRSYLLYVPASYDGSEDWPLVLNLHGYALDAEFQMNFSNMNAVADTAHFLVAYPQGTIINSTVPNTPPQGLGWNISGPGDTSFVSPNDVKDVDFLEKLIDDIGADYSVAQERIYSTGFSNGGMMSYVLACELPGRIAAIAAVGGTIPESRLCSSDEASPKPVFHIHGTADGIVPYEDGDPFLQSVPEILAFWSTQNGCDEQPEIISLPDLSTADSTTVEAYQWQNCAAEMLHYRIEDGGHQWPGGNNLLPFLGHFNLDFNASSEIWNFFNRNPHPNPIGQVIERSFIHEDFPRSYLLYVPASYDGSEDWPLVLNLHGYALNAEFQMNFSNMNAVADTAHFLVAYPQGTIINSTVPNTPPQGLGWNISGPGDTSFVSPNDVKDVDFLEKLIDDIGADYSVAQERVYSTGFSNGGMMSYVLACELPGRIAAIAAVGGTIPENRLCSSDEASPKPVFHIHGTADGIVPYEDGDPFLHSVPEILAFWSTQNGCDEQPEIISLPDLSTADSTTVEAYQWQNCEAEMLHYRVEGGGHQWPGGNNLLPFLGHFNLDFNASSEIWNFFNRNPHPNVVTSIGSNVLLSPLEVNVYPNPFSEGLTVEFELQEDSQVRIQLLNVMGQPIADFGQGIFQAGQHKLVRQLHESSLNTGLYLIRLQTTESQLAYPIMYNPN